MIGICLHVGAGDRLGGPPLIAALLIVTVFISYGHLPSTSAVVTALGGPPLIGAALMGLCFHVGAGDRLGGPSSLRTI